MIDENTNLNLFNKEYDVKNDSFDTQHKNIRERLRDNFCDNLCDNKNGKKKRIQDNNAQYDKKHVREILIDLDEVLKRQPYSRSSIYRKVRTGDFPAPIKIGPNRNAWLESDIDQWIDQRINRSSTPDRERRHDPEGDA